MFPPSETTVAFTGNRTLRAPKGFHSEDLQSEISLMLQELIVQLYEGGKRVFLSGGAVGFDLLAAEQTLKLRAQYADIQLIAVIPFEGQELKFPLDQQQRYHSILSLADQVVVIADRFSMAAYHARNITMVDHSSCVVAYSNGSGRGTCSTMKYASGKGRRVINIYDMLCGREQAEQIEIPF